MSPRKDRPNFYITAGNFEHLIGPGFWKLNDVPQKRWEQIKDHLGQDDTIAVYASGELPVVGGSGRTGGIDWIRLEENPRPTEPDLNAYHYVIGQPTGGLYPVYGPYKKGARVSHWCEETELEAYFRALPKPAGEAP